MMGVFESAFESDKVQKMRNLPTTQKVVLCVLYQSHADGECVAVSHLNTKYLKTCEKRGIQKEKEGFIKILTLMDCSGLIELKGPRGKAELREVCCWFCISPNPVVLAKLKEEKTVAC